MEVHPEEYWTQQKTQHCHHCPGQIQIKQHNNQQFYNTSNTNDQPCEAHIR